MQSQQLYGISRGVPAARGIDQGVTLIARPSLAPTYRADMCGWPAGGFALAPGVACLDQNTAVSSPSPGTMGLLAESTQLLLEAPYLTLQSPDDLCILPSLGLQ